MEWQSYGPHCKNEQREVGKDSYLFKVRWLIQGQVGIQGLLFLIKVIFNPSHNTLFLAASKAPALVHDCLTETAKQRPPSKACITYSHAEIIHSTLGPFYRSYSFPETPC